MGPDAVLINLRSKHILGTAASNLKPGRSKKGSICVIRFRWYSTLIRSQHELGSGYVDKQPKLSSERKLQVNGANLPLSVAPMQRTATATRPATHFRVVDRLHGRSCMTKLRVS